MPAGKKLNKKKIPRNNSNPRRDLAGAAQTLPSRSKPKCRELRSGDVFARPLRFTPYAWSKLLFLRDLGSTEVGGFGISSKDDLFLIEDFALVKQDCTQVTVAFDDDAVADFFEDQVERGRQPERFARCWIHTHPGQSAEPSGTDEETFARVFVEFFERFQRLNIRSNEQLDELVEQAQAIVQGIQPQQLRENHDLRANVATQLGNIQNSLDDLLVDRPRRNILRKPR